MVITRAYRHKARFTPEQEDLARRFAGCARLIYNAGLEQRKLGYAVTGQGMSYMRQTYFLKEVKADRDFAFLSQAPAHVLQQALRDLDRAFANFFAGRSRYPKPRRRGERDGFRYPDPDPKQIGLNLPAHQGQVRLPKLGWVSVRNCYPRLGGRLFEGALKHVSVVREGNAWYVSFCCEVQLADPPAPIGPALGLDVGISNSLATSGGQFVHVAVISDAEWAKIGRLQSQVNRRCKGSRNREKARLALTRYRRRLAARKLDAIHKLTTELASRHELLAIEDLRVANMTRSAKGTLEQPGANVAQKAGLNRAILDQCWGELHRQLDYKTCWYGSALVAVNPSYSSQECRACGHIARENRESQAVFRCVACGHTNHADTNAACIILKRALQAHTAASTAPAGGTPVPGSRTAARRACEDPASSKTPETPGPSRKTRPQGHARLTPART